MSGEGPDCTTAETGRQKTLRSSRRQRLSTQPDVRKRFYTAASGGASMDIGAILARADAAFRSVSAYLNALVIALVILLAGFIIVRLVRTSLTRLFSVVALDDKLTRLLGRRRQYARSARTAVVRALYLVTMYLALRSLHLAGVAIALIVGVVVVIILVSFAIGAADLLPNILAPSRLWPPRWALRGRM